MGNNFTTINKTNNHLSLHTIKYKKQTTPYVFWNPVLVLGQAHHETWPVKPIKHVFIHTQLIL